MNTKATRRTTALFTLCLILLLNPNFNTIDILPDFIAYIILARLAGGYADHVPYFAEVRSACIKLAALTAIKIPAMMIMIANISSGLDIIPLFTLVFAALELVLLIPLISDTFSAVFYIGERGDIPSATTKYRVLGISVSPELLRAFTTFFVIAKSMLSFIPELCHLTFDTDTVMATLRSIYPTVTVFSLLTVLIIGTAWALLARGYIRAIARDGGISAAAYEIAGAEKLARLEHERSVKRRLNSVSLLFYSSVLIFDITFSGVNNGVNVLPRFLFAIALCIIAYNLFDEKVQKRIILAFGLLFSLTSVVSGYHLSSFKERYEYYDLIDFDSAIKLYEPVKLWAAIECIALLGFIFAFGFALIRFVAAHTGMDKSSPGYGKSSVLFAKRMRGRTLIYVLLPALIEVMKAVNVFLLAHPQLIHTDASTGVSPGVTASAVPWFGFAIVVVCTVYVLFSYSYLTELKDEIATKYSDEHTVF